MFAQWVCSYFSWDQALFRPKIPTNEWGILPLPIQRCCRVWAWKTVTSGLQREYVSKTTCTWAHRFQHSNRPNGQFHKIDSFVLCFLCIQDSRIRKLSRFICGSQKSRATGEPRPRTASRQVRKWHRPPAARGPFDVAQVERKVVLAPRLDLLASLSIPSSFWLMVLW